jgi:hypothetical protein
LNQYATIHRQHIRELGPITVTATSADNPTLKLLAHFIRWRGEGFAFLCAHCYLRCKWGEGKRGTSSASCCCAFLLNNQSDSSESPDIKPRLKAARTKIVQRQSETQTVDVHEVLFNKSYDLRAEVLQFEHDLIARTLASITLSLPS